LVSTNCGHPAVSFAHCLIPVSEYPSLYYSEYAAYQLEATPGRPYSGLILDLLSVERNMRQRYYFQQFLQLLYSICVVGGFLFAKISNHRISHCRSHITLVWEFQISLHILISIRLQRQTIIHVYQTSLSAASHVSSECLASVTVSAGQIYQHSHQDHE
jgi:hypothetical protein